MNDTAPNAGEKTLLIVDDDAPYRQRLAQAMEKRGFKVTQAESCEAAVAAAQAEPPRYAVVDLRLTDGSGLDVVPQIRKAREDCRIVMLTGYGNIATAVVAIKAGAVDYLPKPADASFAQLIATYGIVPEHAVFIDDMARNLKPAAALGMTTVLVASDHDWAQPTAGEEDFIDYTTDNLAEWLGDIALSQPGN